MRYLVTIFLALFIFCKPTAYGQFTPAPVVTSQQTVIRNGSTFFVHVVEHNQTIFSICKAYGIDYKTLEEDNPDIRSGLKAGNALYIRKVGATQQKYLNHTVRWYENLTSIAKKYNVTEESIAKLNSLEGDLIQVRQVLKIPLTVTDVKEEETQIVNTVSKVVEQEPEKKYDRFPIFKSPSSETFDVSLILPVGSKVSTSQDGNNNYLDFYQGFLLALEDLKNEGMNLNMKVFDLADYSTGKLLAQTGKLDGSDLIIGPIFKNDITPVLDFASENGIPMVSPMDTQTETLVEGHPKFFQVSSNLYYQQVELLKNLNPRSSVTLISESGNTEAALVSMTKEILESKGINFSSFSYNVLSGRAISPQLASKLSKTSMNDVVVLSNSEAFVSDVLRNLSLLETRSNYRITVYGTPRWRNFEVVDINYFHSMNLHLSLQYYIDYTSDNVKDFLARYRALYGTEPTPYSFQAYDVAYFFLSALYQYGSDFPDKMEGYAKALLQNDMRFVRKDGNSGFINNTARQVIFNPDYSVNVSRFDR